MLDNIALLNPPPAPQLGIHVIELDWLCNNKTTLAAIGHPLWNNVNTYITEFLTKGTNSAAVVEYHKSKSLLVSLERDWCPLKENVSDHRLLFPLKCGTGGF